jgi:hypothetical protein
MRPSVVFRPECRAYQWVPRGLPAAAAGVYELFSTRVPLKFGNTLGSDSVQDQIR